MEKQVTAVDILYKFLYEMESFEGFDPYDFNQEKVFAKAKEIEKEQIEDAYSEGVDDEYEYHINNEPRKNSEKYYNENFKTESINN